MKAIARPIGTGKTKELLLLAAENNGYVFTNNKRALQVKAEAYGIYNLEIIDWDDLFGGALNSAKPIYIHKLEDVMQELLYADYGLNLEGFTVALE